MNQKRRTISRGLLWSIIWQIILLMASLNPAFYNWIDINYEKKSQDNNKFVEFPMSSQASYIYMRPEIEQVSIIYFFRFK